MTLCAQCSKPFDQPNPYRTNKYCSPDCRRLSRFGPKPERQRRQINTCQNPDCGKTFETGGRSGKHTWAKYCSRVCAGVGAVRHPLPIALSAVDAAYLAGFFDGEGSIIRIKGHSWRITVYQNDETVIRWIGATTGTGHIGRRNPAKQNNLVKQPAKVLEQWYWNLYGRNAAALLRQLLPYMKVKRARAEEMLRDFQPT